MINEGLVPQDVIFRSHGEIFVKTWKACLPYIKHLRHVSSPNFVVNLEIMASNVTKYLKTNYPNVKLDPTQLSTKAEADQKIP